MINLLIGSPGGGKSYEAVVYHVLPALISGRKVITNLPLNVEEFDKIEPGSSRLISLRQPSPDNPRPFSTLADYGDTWRNDRGQGPLYIIDECHFPLPRGIGDKGTKREVEEWYSMHRHEGADVLLLTQSYRKVSANIVDLVQVCYRVRKNVALGSMNSYTRKVRDGVRGEVLNIAVRTYKPQYFPLYKSHTLTNGAVQESMTQDIRPIWKHWSFMGAALLFPLGIIGLVSAGNPMKPAIEPGPEIPVVQDESITVDGVTLKRVSVKPVQPEQAPQEPPEPASPSHPYKGYGVHVRGYLAASDGSRTVYQFGVSQNGQLLYNQTHEEVVRAGYKVEAVNDCIARLTYGEYSFFAVCDLPQVGMNPGGNFGKGSSS